jgi:mono/diheme cytochrome c family protein
MNRFAIVAAPFLALSLLHAQDLPDGKGKKEVETICTACHGVDPIVSMRASKDEWASVVDSMVAKGATGTKEELDAIVEYLAKNFGPEKKVDARKAAK